MACPFNSFRPIYVDEIQVTPKRKYRVDWPHLLFALIALGLLAVAIHHMLRTSWSRSQQKSRGMPFKLLQKPEPAGWGYQCNQNPVFEETDK